MVLHGEYLAKPTYEIIRTLNADGSTSECRLAKHTVYERDVVQKTISLLGIEDTLAFSEPALLNSFEHEHLAKVWEAQWDPTYPQAKAITFVMPYYEGGSVLGRLTDGHRFSVGQAVKIVSGVLKALAYLHFDELVVHRDVKPGNVFLDRSLQHAFLGDLGCASRLDETGFAEAGGGTLLYRPPEHITGHYSPAGDIYSAGLVLHECLNGPLPYEQLNADFVKVERRLERGLPAIPKAMLSALPHVPPKLALIVRKMAAADPGDRYPSAGAALRALLDIRHLDWRADESAEDARTWTGRTSPSARRGHRSRIVRIQTRPLKRGPRAGSDRVDVSWRFSDELHWRAINILQRDIVAGDRPGLAQAFRATESHLAQIAAAR